MDAGQVNFVPKSVVDLTKSVGLKDSSTYCVAPITLKGATLASYDFWVVGTNCCSGNGETDFRCAPEATGEVLSGIRWVSQYERPFFRLAVQQAQSTHNIKSIHPLFSEWVQDPMFAKEQRKKQAYRFAFLAIIIHFVVQSSLVGLVASCYSKLSLASLREAL